MIVILDDGKVKASGSFTELQRSGLDISAYIAQNEADSPASAVAEEEEEGNGVEEEVMSIAGKHTPHLKLSVYICVDIYLPYMYHYMYYRGLSGRGVQGEGPGARSARPD